jgi:formylmethanofuran dehydrogenase subunit D
MTAKILFAAVLLLAVSTLTVGQSQLAVKATNKLPVARANQTIEIAGKDLAALGEKDLNKIHVSDSSGKEVLCQAVDTDYDELHQPDVVIFQADFAANQTKSFVVRAGKKQEYTKDDFKAYGRFVRERFDDFAWENNLIAHRTYGKALITWKGEPLTSSAIDIWTKRTSRLVINDWYMVDNYHADAGEGMDNYSAGPSRGVGASGIWSNNQLYVAQNFVDSRVLTNGPIRVMFELVYEPFEVNGTKVSQVLRISLDAGSQLDHFETFYKSQTNEALSVAIGIKKFKDEQKEISPERGWIAIWEPSEKNQGMQGVAAIFDARKFDRQAEDKLNNLIVLKPGSDKSVSYWAGFAWDRAGKITSAKAWKEYVDAFAEGLRSPIEVNVSVIQ